MNIDEIISSWQTYFQNLSSWQELTKGIKPRKGGCGLIYEIPNPIDRPNESLAIADMRKLPFAEPHYHGEIEIYFVLQGQGLIVVGDKEEEIHEGSLITIPSNIAHYTIPTEDLIIAAVNTPPFKIESYIPLEESQSDVFFDKAIFDRLTSRV